MPKVLVTGATGFVGRAVCSALGDAYSVVGTSRNPPATSAHGISWASASLDPQFDWLPLLREVEVVVHLAARVHVLQENEPDPIRAFMAANCEATRNLAQSAAAAGVRRFIFLSTVGVHGSFSRPGSPLDESSALAPHNAYSRSKLAAEIELREISRKTGLETVILRCPLVYGEGAPGNFGTLLRWVNRQIPLPLSGIRNQRSLLSVDNLADLIRVCIDHPAAAGETFLVRDGQDTSTPGLIRAIALARGKRARLLPFPSPVLFAASAVLGRARQYQQLAGNLQINDSRVRQRLGWSPPLTLDQALLRLSRTHN